MRNKTFFLSLALPLILACAPSLRAADPVVSNVVFAQRAETKLVDITFDVSDADSDQLNILVEISDDSGTTFTVPATAISGDTSVNATPTPAAKALVWDAALDFNQQFNSTMVVRVIADDGLASLPTPGPSPAGMVLVPAGSFEMGRQSGSGGAEELPVHTVFVSAFYLDQFEVTKALWDDVKSFADANGYGFDNAGSGQGAFHPVHSVNWNDVVKWCNARSEQEGLTPVYYTDATQTTVYRTGNINLAASFVNGSASGFRLPTEAEWEKAARGSREGKTYPWGNTIGGGDANYDGSGDPFDGEFPGTTPVGYYDGDQVPAGVNRANGYGLYDMSGNIREWCWDWYDAGYYAVSPANDPQGPASGVDRVLRGGSWNPFPSPDLRCAGRRSDSTLNGFDDYGFRSARGL